MSFFFGGEAHRIQFLFGNHQMPPCFAGVTMWLRVFVCVCVCVLAINLGNCVSNCVNHQGAKTGVAAILKLEALPALPLALLLFFWSFR